MRYYDALKNLLIYFYFSQKPTYTFICTRYTGTDILMCMCSYARDDTHVVVVIVFIEPDITRVWEYFSLIHPNKNLFFEIGLGFITFAAAISA